MYTVRTDFDVIMGHLQNQHYFQGVYCNAADHRFCKLLYNTTDHCFHTICGVAIHTVSSLEITFILQPRRSDVKIGLARAHENRLLVSTY